MLHIPFPERLSDEAFARKWSQCRYLLRKGFAFGVKWTDDGITPSNELKEEEEEEESNQEEEYGDL